MLGGDPIDLGDMLLRGTHAVDELPIVAQKQQSRSLLVQPPDGLHALDHAACRALTQTSRQQRVHGRVARRFLRALRAGGFVQGDIGLFAIRPFHALNAKAKSFVKAALGQGICANAPLTLIVGNQFHMPLLNQSSTNAAGSETLRIKNIL